MREKTLNHETDPKKNSSFVLFVSLWLGKIATTEPYILAWVFAMICVPIAHWIASDDIIPATATITTLLQFTAVTAILWRHWGARRTLLTFVLVAVVTWSAEALGSKTDFPFGAYDYTPLLQPQLWGVPLLIPLAWWMMLGPAWAVASAVVGEKNRLAFIAVSAFAITAWDLFLDPQMVGWGFWTWHSPSGYFGIPFINYFGWLLTSALVTFLVRPDKLPLTPLIVVYAIVWILQSIGLALFWNQPGPALFGFLAMGSLLVLAIRRLNRD